MQENDFEETKIVRSQCSLICNPATDKSLHNKNEYPHCGCHTEAGH
jgi:hypothetical protein